MVILIKYHSSLDTIRFSNKAAKTLIVQFINKNETRYKLLDGERNPALLFKLRYDWTNLVSISTIRQIIEAFLVFAMISKIQQPYFNKDIASIDSVQVKQTKFQLRIWNLLLMMLELAILLKNPLLTKRVIWELFNRSLPFL